MMKKLFAALTALALCLCGVCGAWAEAAPDYDIFEDNWYVSTAQYITEQMNALADNEAYVELFIGMGEDTDGFADQMAALKGLTPDGCNIYLLRTDALESLAANYQMDELTVAANRNVMENLLRRMNMNLPGLLNASVGGSLWMAIASALTYTETFLMPEDFVPQAVLLLYAECEAAVLVTYTQTGENTITVNGTFVRHEVYDDPAAQQIFGLLWERP